MRASEFDFTLPPELVAQTPAARRDEARLYVLPRRGGAPRHAIVSDLVDVLPPEALLVVNDTRVIPARLRGRKPTGGRVELLAVQALTPSPLPQAGEGRSREPWREVWRCLAGASKPLRPGTLIALDGADAPTAEVLAVRGGEADVAFAGDGPGGFLGALERIGEVPLPPYIERAAPPSDDDRARYQTVYARHPGAVAAPTAGLHFTPELLAALQQRGVELATVTLHVGMGTFAPLREDDVTKIDALHAERYLVSDETSDKIARARAAGRPVIAVGTTTVRTLETAAAADGTVRPGAGETRIFIKPGHAFRAVDGMVTNFHLPKTTLLMLVAAFLSSEGEAGRERLLDAYADAISRRYRFYSYGDAMVIV